MQPSPPLPLHEIDRMAVAMGLRPQCERSRRSKATRDRRRRSKQRYHVIAVWQEAVRYAEKSLMDQVLRGVDMLRSFRPLPRFTIEEPMRFEPMKVRDMETERFQYTQAILPELAARMGHEYLEQDAVHEIAKGLFKAGFISRGRVVGHPEHLIQYEIVVSRSRIF